MSRPGAVVVNAFAGSANRDATGGSSGGRGLARIRAAVPALRPAERRVAAAVLDDPGAISELSISALAQQCSTSGTTVLRFCRAVGFDGYPELRLALAREVSRAEAVGARHGPLDGTIDAADDLADIVAKVTSNDARAIDDTAATLDLDVLDRAVGAVVGARQIDVYGIGASGFVALDLHQKLYRIGLPAHCWESPDAAVNSAALLVERDVAIAISHSGSTAGTVDALRLARDNGATTIAVTNVATSALARASDLVLTTVAHETTFRSGAMASRIAQLVVVDCLFVGAAHRRFDDSQTALDKTRAAIQTRRPRSRP